ncbi:MAG TPA: thioesterase family protein [Candidatus Baltobacteraceae bacterium]|jgi:YbgC/YbaW family acyl-CoA thioester hydrolase|nr:thioesterase family protein [Candidatus Baltobacteraceae bacterium]
MPKFKDTTPAGARIFETRVMVQWADIDIAGIMYFAAYQRAVERAEMDFFGELGFPYNTVFEEYDIWLPRVHVEADYHKPAFMGDWLTLRTHIKHVGSSSLRWQTVVHNERTAETGASFHLTVACMDRRTHKSRPLPPVMRAALIGCIA